MSLVDKKLIIHVSLEIVLLGSMAYFFNNRSKRFENRLYDAESRLSRLEAQLASQNDELQLLKKIKQSSLQPQEPTMTSFENEFKAFKQFQEQAARMASDSGKNFTRPVFTPATVEVIESEEDPLDLSLTTPKAVSTPPLSAGTHTPPPSVADLDKEIESELNELNELI